MKILSIDVGIRNLSFCLFDILLSEENTANNLKIIKWDNIDLSEKTESRCIEIDKNGLCDKPAKFRKEGKCYCLKHSKKQNYLQPTKELTSSYLYKQKIQNIIEIADKYKIKYENPPKKANLIALLTEFSNTNCYTEIQKTNATKIDLVTIGKNIQHKFDEILNEQLSSIDSIIIENQIGPIANKMKTIQGMLSQYFIMRNNNILIEFISASNKLKDFLPKDNKEKTDYKQRKKLGIQKCLEFINNDFRFKEWENFINKHNKKDDLSDCFLQGMWFIKHKVNGILMV
jgi:hypothetical protein